MGKPILRPTGDDTFIIEYEPSVEGDDFSFENSLARSLEEEMSDIEAACNRRYDSFRRLLDILPEDEEVALDWDDDPSQAAVMTCYYSGIDHFLLGAWEMAAALFETTLELDPEDHLDASVTLAYTYLAMEEFESFDEIIEDINEKSVDRVVLELWSGYRRTGKLDSSLLERFKSRFAPYYAEFTADTHPINAAYVKDIRNGNASPANRARKMWVETEHLWTDFPGFIETMKDNSNC